jgi:hypothetical protein
MGATFTALFFIIVQRKRIYPKTFWAYLTRQMYLFAFQKAKECKFFSAKCDKNATNGAKNKTRGPSAPLS